MKADKEECFFTWYLLDKNREEGNSGKRGGKREGSGNP